MIAQAYSQTITAAAAYVVKNRERFTTEGQRALFLVEELVESGSLSLVSVRNDADVLSAAAGAIASFDITRARDIRRVICLLKSAKSGDAGAKKAIESLRSGSHPTGEAAYCYWKKREKKSRSEVPGKRKLRPREFMPKTKLSEEDRLWALAKAAEICSKLKTSGQRSIAMSKALIARGLASDKKSGGPAAASGVRKVLAKALGVNTHELGLGLTILRRAAAGQVTPGAVEALESGRYESCGHINDEFTGPGRRKFIEEIKSPTWLRARATEIAKNGAFVMPSQRALAFLEAMIQNRVLDPSLRISKKNAATAVFEAAAKWLPGVSQTEAESCWALLRAVNRRELPAHVLDDIRSGATSAANITKTAVGGISGLAKLYRSGKVKAEVAPLAVESAPLAVASSGAVKHEHNAIGDPVAAIHELASSAGEKLDSIIEAAEASKDSELGSFAKRFREQIGLYKMQAARLRNRRSAARSRRSK